MSVYGVRCFNDKGIETGAKPGRAFALDTITVVKSNTPGNKSYTFDTNKFTLRGFSVGNATSFSTFIRVAVSGNKISWSTPYTLDASDRYFIVVTLEEK